MSAVPLMNMWTTADIDSRLKDSAAMLSEWTKLLEKAEKTSNPNEIPVSDIEQHIRLKRKLNESLGSLARIAQAHANRSKMSHTETNKAASSSAATKSAVDTNKNPSHTSQPPSATNKVATSSIVPSSQGQGMPGNHNVQHQPLSNQSNQSVIYNPHPSDTVVQRVSNTPMNAYTNIGATNASLMPNNPDGLGLPTSTNPSNVNANYLGNHSYNSPQQQYPVMNQSGMMGYHTIVQSTGPGPGPSPGPHLQGMPYPQQHQIPGTQQHSSMGINSSQTIPPGISAQLIPPQSHPQYPPNYYLLPQTSNGFQAVPNQSAGQPHGSQPSSIQQGSLPGGMSYPVYPQSFPIQHHHHHHHHHHQQQQLTNQIPHQISSQPNSFSVPQQQGMFQGPPGVAKQLPPQQQQMLMQHPPPSQLHRAPNGLPTQMPNAHHSHHNPSNSSANNSQSMPSNMSNQMYHSGAPPQRNIVYMSATYSSQPTLQPTSQMQQMMPAQQFL